jgi:hypothetical protein
MTNDQEKTAKEKKAVKRGRGEEGPTSIGRPHPLGLQSEISNQKSAIPTA